MSANSGEEIYNGAIITGQTPDGQPVRVPRYQPSADYAYLSPAQFANPSFDTNTTGWSAGGINASIARDTTVFDSSPASLRLNTGATFGTCNPFSASWAGSLIVGKAYRISLRLRREAAATGLVQFQLATADLTTLLFQDDRPNAEFPAGQFVTYTSPVFVVPGNGQQPSFAITLNGTANAILGYLDTIEVLEARPTIVDRRGFKRRKILPIQNALPSDLVAAQSIGDTWLPGHKATPFKGSVVVVGAGTVRDVLTGEDVPPERLLLDTTELIRFSDRLDPDTGGQGRDGRIAAVSYSATTDTAQVTVDNSRSDFEALLARYGVLGGS